MANSDGAGAPTPVKEVTTASFRADVLTASTRQPVLVDFWAPWCGPCKQLAPALEKAVADSGGKVALVKMNIDEHPQIAGQLGIQSIPAVIAFDKGQPVDGFVGALPESQVRGFIERLVGPLTAAADELVAEAEAAAAKGDAAGAAGLYARVLTEDESNLKAIAGLAKLHVDAGDLDQAKAVLSMAPAPGAGPRARPGDRRGGGGVARRRAGLGDRRPRAAGEGGRREPRQSPGALRPRAGAQRQGTARRGGRRAADDLQARPQMERRSGAQAAAAVLRGLGPDGSGRRDGAPQAVGDPVLTD